MVAGRGLFVHTAGPNVALIKSPGSGVFARNKEVTIVIGGRLLAVPVIHRVDTLSLELRTIQVSTHAGATLNGVLVNVNSCCQVKIRAWHPPDESERTEEGRTALRAHPPKMDLLAIRLAAQHFIGKKDADIEKAIQRTLEGHQRAIIGTLTVEKLIGDRKSFSESVLDMATHDMREMGLSIVSYTVSEITDDTGYIEALGAKEIAQAKGNAKEGTAFHQSRAAAVAAEKAASAHVTVNSEEERKIQADKKKSITDAMAQTEVAQRRAVQERARDISLAEQDERLLVLQQRARAAEAREELNVERELVKKMNLRMQQDVHAKADAMLYRARAEADGVRAAAAAEAEKIRVVGEAQADAAKAMMTAEMDMLERKVTIWNKCTNNAALVEKALEVLPELAKAIAEPLSKTEKMVFVGGGSGGGGPSAFAREFERIAAEVPETIPALSGFDLKKALNNLTGTSPVEAK